MQHIQKISAVFDTAEVFYFHSICEIFKENQIPFILPRQNSHKVAFLATQKVSKGNGIIRVGADVCIKPNLFHGFSPYSY